MVERDNEDMWFECLAWAADHFVSKKHTNPLQRSIVIANQLYDACKEKTKKAQAERPKLVPQMKA